LKYISLVIFISLPVSLSRSPSLCLSNALTLCSRLFLSVHALFALSFSHFFSSPGTPPDTYLVGCGGGAAAGLADGQINPACNSPLDNPGLANVRERIRIIYRPDAAGTTVLWMINFQAIALNDTSNGKYGYTLTPYSGTIGSPTAGTSSFVALKANTAPDVNSYPFWNPCCCCDAYLVCEKKTYGHTHCHCQSLVCLGSF